MSLANGSGAGKSSYERSSHGGSFFERLDDLFAVETPVLDENLARVTPPDDYPSQVDTGHIALKRIRIQRRPAAFWIELHTQALNERIVRVITSKSEYLLCRDSLRLSMLLDHHFVSGDFLYPGLE